MNTDIAETTATYFQLFMYSVFCYRSQYYYCLRFKISIFLKTRLILNSHCLLSLIIHDLSLGTKENSESTQVKTFYPKFNFDLSHTLVIDPFGLFVFFVFVFLILNICPLVKFFIKFVIFMHASDACEYNVSKNLK